LYLIITDDFYLHFFNENWLHLAKLYLNTRLITHAVFLEKESRLILGGIDGLTSFHLDVICKHDPKQNLALNPKGDDMMFHAHNEGVLEGSPKWCKGLKLQGKKESD
jgi:hypothetical protein